jgi:competence protein ComEC
VDLQVLHPFGHEGAKAKPNAVSCVLRIQDAQGRSLLLTGDIERDQEAALVHASEESYSMPLRSEGLIVPHHGSRTSSTDAFLRAVQPSWSLAQAGYRNRYGHPAQSVVTRYDDLGIPLLSSPWCGALFWNTSGLQCWRQVQPRHWHDHPVAGPLLPAGSR